MVRISARIYNETVINQSFDGYKLTDFNVLVGWVVFVNKSFFTFSSDGLATCNVSNDNYLLQNLDMRQI